MCSASYDAIKGNCTFLYRQSQWTISEMRRLTILAVALAFYVHVNTLAQEKTEKTGFYDLMTKGYAALQHSPREALPFFEEAVKADSTNLLARRQLGALYINLGRPADALTQLLAAQRLSPSDTTALQLGYLLNGLGRNAEARTWFSGLLGSSDSTIAAQARFADLALELQVCSEQEPWWWRIYAAPYYEGRFRDLILWGSVYGGKYIGEGRKLSWFGTAGLAADTRSSSGALPEIYADNFVLVGGGLRAQPIRGLSGDLQAGITFDLLKRPEKSIVRPDLRAVASYGNGIYPAFTTPDVPTWSVSLLADLYTSAGYYSRYENIIGYAQGRAGIRAFAYRLTAVDCYLRGDFTWDTEREFYNNTAEASIGLRVIPDHRWGVQVLIEYHEGWYWGPDAGNPYGTRYNSTRLFVILDRFFCW